MRHTPWRLRDRPIASVPVPETEPTYFVHPTAIVEDGATVGEGSSVWHHAHIRSGARVGASSNLGKNVYVDSGVVVGERNKIQNNVSVYVGVQLEDDVFVGPSAVFTNDRVPRAFNTEWKVVETHVATGASIGANATIVCGVRLGEYCMIAAGATVTHDVGAHQLVAGNPARHLGWVCRCGALLTRDDDQPLALVCDACAKENDE
jgi:UDP-2-acetamido-3-amino-2,3-dideoxy-glucuronate N-acetyltransferase